MESALPEHQAAIEIEKRSLDDLVTEIVREAMRDAWNDICADSGHRPSDLSRAGNKTYFEPRTWATLTGNMVAVALREHGFQKAGD